MLRILSSPKRMCDGVTRRDLLQVGGLSACGLGLPHLLEREAGAEGVDVAGFGRANCMPNRTEKGISSMSWRSNVSSMRSRRFQEPR